jgi:hypothetical protein
MVPTAGRVLCGSPMRQFPKIRVKAEHPYAWLWEPLETESSFELRTMFGAKAVYLGGKLQLCFTAKEEPWRGVLVCTDKTHHPSMTEQFPVLRPHPVLPKWLYLSESIETFESVARQLVALVRKRDGRIGVIAKPKRVRRI